ncbi:2-dehydro-3-deoxy-6-phosphogalactonate aldolase [Aminobacter sp. Y103A]|uniref:2-dehydro-3-deoxy-6-phosphogalactonate aldolase n=1 Tax=Aminobacter sp. Y103A TaxID=1870862 RepID=UPI002573A1C7|nr:2-dehydro-3-deoxy-6-phosphogalactonate aldolase [Aminobacter sp. SS-2016]BBD36632.1 2-dehydro-3-deoxy-6-phosphogalactonate aldolase [Aminobacter sp. SS-2016]
MTRTAQFPKLRRGLVAILRGLTPDQAVAVAGVIYEAGIEAIEIPLNSPEPFASIASIVGSLPVSALIGAGTVLEATQVDSLAGVGGRLVVSPNIDAEVMAAAARQGMVTMPGVMSPTEAFKAVKLGASALKFFPASVIGAGGIAAMRAVLPKDTVVGAVGGVSDRDFASYRAAGVTAFGLGTSLFRPGMGIDEVAARARSAVAAWDAAFEDENNAG